MLIEGTNTPIILEYDESTDTMLDFSALLSANGTILKAWKKEDAVFEGAYVYLPLEQTETIDFPSGMAVFEVKWTNADGEVNFNEPIKMIIEKRIDRTILHEVA